VAVVGEDGEPVAFGAPGELIIGGVGLGRYLDPELDARRYAPQPALGWTRAYRTGDIVRETDAGLSFVGRRDDQVKLGGRRLELGEIDAHLASAPGVRAAAAAVQRTEAGNPVLVGYVTGDVELERVRAHLAGHLPHGVVPLVVAVDTLPVRSSGKVDRQALPWPPPPPPHRLTRELQGTCAWLAERWAEQLGPLPIGADSDFFELGGSSVAAAKLVSVLRADFPAVAVADVYHHRRLHAFAERLEHLGAGATTAFDAPEVAGSGRWGAVQVAGVLVLIAYLALQGLIGVLAFNRWQGGNLGPAVGWGWIVGGWAVLFSVPARAALVLVLQRVLLRDLRPGRSPRRGSLACRVWFVERFSQLARLETLAGTPWAGRYARLAGATVGAGARLGTLPPATSILRIGTGATLEPDVDVHGWWMESDELVVGTLVIEAGASVGTRSVLMPGVTVGAGAEVEPGSVVSEDVPAGERWAGIPARHVGTAGELWPQVAAPAPTRARLWQALYAAGLITQTLLPLACAIPALLLVQVFAPSGQSLTAVVSGLVLAAPVLATAFLLTYAVGVALAVRALTLLVRPGLHPDLGAVGWALWLSETLMAQARVILFPLYSTVYTRPWLRLMGVRVGRRTEISTGVGLNRLVSFGELSFAADDVVFATARARDGWLEVAPIAVGDRSFLGNGALVRGGTAFGHDSLAGVLTIPPRDPRHGTSWFGWPALELPRVPDAVEAARTTDPSRARVAARAAMEAFRILSPFTISLVLGELDFLAVDAVGRAGGPAAMVAVAPLALLAAALAATAVTILAKWTLIGRYRSGNHPLWSFFVWRDEIINSYQEQLAGGWLLNLALGTPIMPAYLRAMGARVGDRVYIETLTITEFDLVDLGDDCAVNRRACVETHLFHDRLMRIGPTTIEARSTLGPASAVLPDSTVGDHCWLGARSVVVRGERLPPRTAWHGAPVVAV
jgi:non-ribosomal peptide synthetase-like protein